MKHNTLPYEQRSDLDKVRSQWRKLTGLHSREEWSAAVVRASTAAEIAANFAIRAELRKRSTLSEKFVSHLLRSANGLGGKMGRILVPLAEGTKNKKKVATLAKLAQAINTDRNAIVHQGQFRGESAAQKTIRTARKFVQGLVRLYEPAFKLSG